MIWLLVLAGIASLVIAFGVGHAVGKSHKTSDVTTEANDQNLSDCRRLCTQLDHRHSDRCNAQRDEAMARSRADALRAELTLALAVVGGFLAAGATAAAAGAPGWIAAAIAFTAAGVAALIAAYIAGLLSAADDDVARYQTALRAAGNLETEARNLLLASECPQAMVDSCLSRLQPCS